MVIKQNVGIDASKDQLEVCFSTINEQQQIKIKGTRHFTNTAKGLEELVDWALKKSTAEAPLGFTVEATGVYHEELAYFLQAQGLEVHVVLPNKAKAYAKSLNVKSKTDKKEANVLARMGLERRLTPWKPISASMRQLKKLSRERSALLQDKTALYNRLHAEAHSYEPQADIQQRRQAHLDFMEDQIEAIESRLKELVQADWALSAKIDKLQTIPGVGFITAVTIAAETDGFALFRSRAQLVSYAGYDVVERQSGSSVLGKTRISRIGNRYVRRALYFPAWTLIKHDEHHRDVYERICERTRIKMKGGVAVQRRLLCLMYTLWKTDAVFDPDYEAKKAQQKQQAKTLAPKM
jgi:transposase